MLTVDCGLYLPHYKTINIYFMKALLMKKKKAIKTSVIKHLNVPQYSTLSVEKCLEFAFQFEQIVDYLPEERDLPLLPRQVSP